MALPNTRQLTLNPSDPVPSSLLNALQDCIVGGKYGPSIIQVHPSVVQPQLATSIAYNFVGDYAEYTSGGSAKAMFPVSIESGARILSITANLYGAAVNSITLVSRPDGAGIPGTIGTASPTTTAAWSLTTITVAGGGYVVGVAESVALLWSPSAAARIGSIRLVIDHP